MEKFGQKSKGVGEPTPCSHNFSLFFFIRFIRTLLMILPSVGDGEAAVEDLDEPHAHHLVGEGHF